MVNNGTNTVTNGDRLKGELQKVSRPVVRKQKKLVNDG